MILNNVKNLKTITVDEFLSLNFNKLKDENRNVDKLVNSIKKTGWNFPVFVWAGNDFVIDGAGRKLAVEELLKQGETITEIPVIEIFAETLEEAKLKTLEASSQFGDITKESFEFFTQDLDVDFGIIEIDGISDDSFIENDNKEEKDIEIKSMFEVIVTCDDIQHQEEVFNNLTELGYICRTLNL